MYTQAQESLVMYNDHHAGFRGTGFVDFSRNGGFVEGSNVDGRDGGQATLTFRYALGGDNASRTVLLTVNGTAQTITFEPTGGWNQWRTVSKNVTLRACPPNTVRVESLGYDVGNIDQVFVTR
jgi:hypothetical protein